jgi:hypothetical protein
MIKTWLDHVRGETPPPASVKLVTLSGGVPSNGITADMGNKDYTLPLYNPDDIHAEYSKINPHHLDGVPVDQFCGIPAFSRGVQRGLGAESCKIDPE